MPTKKFGNQSLKMPAHDNMKFGARVGNQNPTSDCGMNAGKSRSKRGGKGRK